MNFEWKTITAKKLAAVVSRQLLSHDVEAILVGGACVSIYSQNQYLSKDLDLITYAPMQTVREALKDLGFFSKNQRQFERKSCPFYLEFIAPPVAIGDQPITEFNELKTSLGKIKLLTPTDCVKDRLAAFFYWDDYQSFNQAVLVAKKHDVDLKAIQKWAKAENQLKKYRLFTAALPASRRER